MYQLREKILSGIVSQINKKQEEVFEYALRNMAVPPIKGEITKGKVKWRGIKLVSKNDVLASYQWLEQRGKQISNVIIFEAIIPGIND